MLTMLLVVCLGKGIALTNWLPGHCILQSATMVLAIQLTAAASWQRLAYKRSTVFSKTAVADRLDRLKAREF